MDEIKLDFETEEFAEFAEEDRALANEGLAEFRQVMSEYDDLDAETPPPPLFCP